MRHELTVDGLVVTSDNSAGIGEKEWDTVKAPDIVTAKFAARVALLEQWAAGSEPQAMLLHNFSGAVQWDRYMAGIAELFAEAEMEMPPVSGSSETNMETLQSGLAVTMLGKQIRSSATAESLSWFVYGVPLVGEAVLVHQDRAADLKLIKSGLESGIIDRVWPVGSKGIAREFELLMGRRVEVSAAVNIHSSGGPGTCVLLGLQPENSEQLQKHFGKFLFALAFK